MLNHQKISKYYEHDCRSSSSNIYQNFKDTNFPLEKGSDWCDNISGQHVTTDPRRVVNECGCNHFCSDLIRICNQFEKVYSSVSPKTRISRLGDSVEMILFLLQRKTEEIAQMSQSAMEDSLALRDLTKLLGKLTSKIEAILPVKLQILLLQLMQIQALRRKYHLRICDYSGSIA